MITETDLNKLFSCSMARWRGKEKRRLRSVEVWARRATVLLVRVPEEMKGRAT